METTTGVGYTPPRVAPDRSRRPIVRALFLFFMVALASALAGPSSPASESVPKLQSELHFSVEESALFELLSAATPYTVTVGSGLTAVDLILRDPADLILSEGKARFRIGVRGATIPVDQVLEPELTVEYDPHRRQYFVVVTSLPVQVPLLGTLDVREALPPIAIPALVEQLWELDSRPLGARIHIRRIAILDHRLEISADVDFPPIRRR
jgi:hypothetical protein